MFHPDKVLQAIWYATRRRVRLALGLRARRRPPPVLSQPLEVITQRHGLIIRSLQAHLPPGVNLQGTHLCEVGPGDCLAAASFYLAQGARQVDLVEIAPPVVNKRQQEVLRALQQKGLPVDLTFLGKGPEPQLDTSRVLHHPCYMEALDKANCYDGLSSFSVVEHVEDLHGFHCSCLKALKPGGWALHLVDLGGHEQFEDPLPPLDFQTYPDWLYTLMYPRYYRATRRFLEEHVAAAEAAGFAVRQQVCLRRAEEAYLKQIWPWLRPAARHRSQSEVAVIEFALLMQKP